MFNNLKRDNNVNYEIVYSTQATTYLIHITI